MAPATANDWLRLPPGRTVQLRERRTVFIREVAGPPDAPVLILLHGLMVTADLNWFGTFRPLGEQYRVIAMDLFGHGHSPSHGRRLRLEECADDVAELAAELGIPRFVAVGYSMGGLVAQLVWQRHPALVSGLVLCSTARNFRGSPLERLTSLSLPGLASLMQFNPMLHLLGSSSLGAGVLRNLDDPGLRAWANQQMERTSLATTAGALDEVSRFASHGWAGQIDVPCAVIVTGQDQIVPPTRQRRLAAAIPGSSVHEIDAGHGVCVSEPERFSEILLDACHSVVQRSGDSAWLPTTGTADG